MIKVYEVKNKKSVYTSFIHGSILKPKSEKFRKEGNINPYKI